MGSNTKLNPETGELIAEAMIEARTNALIQAPENLGVTREKFYLSLQGDLDNYEDTPVATLNEEETKRVNLHLSKLTTGSSAMVPLYCGGDKCPFSNRCPLFAVSKHPEGKQCPIENRLIKEFIYRYMEEYDINPTIWTEVRYAAELAEIDIYLMRIHMVLARPEHADMMIEQLTGFSVKGAPIVQTQLHPILEQKERLESRRSRIIKFMVGDRQEKYKKQAALKEVQEDNIANKMVEARRAIDKLISHVGKTIKDSETIEEKLSPEDLFNSSDDV